MSFSGHHYRQIGLYTVIHAMPEFALGWVPGSGICLYQETVVLHMSNLFLKPCWCLVNRPFSSMCPMILSLTSFSIIFDTTEVKLMGL